jgi:hypothetical protein
MSAPEFQDRSRLGNPGSPRVPRAGESVSLSRTFLGMRSSGKDRFGETPKPTRGTRALPEGLARATWL